MRIQARAGAFQDAHDILRATVRATLLCALCATTAATAPALARAADAQGPSYHFDISDQTLPRALRRFAQVAGQEIIFTESLFEGAKPVSLKGDYTAEDALQKLLRGTGLIYERSPSGAIMIKRAGEGATWNRTQSDAAPNTARGEGPGTPEAPVPVTGAAAATTEPSSRSQNATDASANDQGENASGGGALSEVLVTGTRIRREGGYDQPTPVTSLSADSLLLAAPTTVADGLNQLPQFALSRNGANCCVARPGGNFLNLRGLNPNTGGSRQLVLLDGDRLTPTLPTGEIDVNLLPELLLQRLDVVTGGASAAYGSDAVSGVVNYIIDKKFEGLKGVAQTGLSSYGDNRNVKYGLAGGTAFAEGRGHVVLGFEHFDSDGIPSINDRSYASHAHFLAGNGTTVPYNVVFDARGVVATNGGVIVNASNQPVATTAAPLAGILFEPGGSSRNFVLGTPVPGSPEVRIGGDGYVYGPLSALGSQRTEKLYSRFSFDLTDSVAAFVRLNAGETHSFQNVLENGQRTTNAFTIFRENAFLPANIAAQMDSAGVTSFRLGRQSNDFGLVGNDYETRTFDVSLGFEGSLGSNWTWQANYASGATRVDGEVTNNVIVDNLYAAADAVVNPANGQIVCRVTLTNPGVFPGCVPINLFGAGSPSQAALDYVTGDSPQLVKNRQKLAAASLQGDLFTLPAGPLSVALGAEYRDVSLTEESNVLALQQKQAFGVRGMPTSVCPTVATCSFGRYSFANFGESDVSSYVREAFFETLIPVLKDLPAVKSLELNGAYRYTDYETSGSVGTWKVGLSYEPFEDLRLRATRSRDIRAPSLSELFSGPITSFVIGVVDPATGLANPNPFLVVRQGNPNLVPEEADTKTIGLIYRPRWLPGFAGSVDYYDIDIGGALAATTPQLILGNCQAGDATACSLITRDPATGNIQQVVTPNINQDSRFARGIDFDLSYSHPLGAGTFGVRTLFTRVFDFVDTVGGVEIQYAGLLGRPHWRGNLDLTYDTGNFSFFVQERFIGEVGVYINNALAGREQFVDPTFGNVFYTDLTAIWRVGGEQKYELYGTVNNAFNRKPPLSAINTNPGQGMPTRIGENGSAYDVVGTYFTVGARVRF